MKIAILGFGDQGKSSYEYWDNPSNEITICDSREDIEAPKYYKTKLGKDFLKDLDYFDLIVRAAPIIHPREILNANSDSSNILDKLTTNTNEFFRVCPSKNIIAVTGTKGKGTTSTLIAKMLEASGKTVHLGGNIGIPPLEMLKENIKPEDWVVLELANFQLIDFKYSPRIAVCLMVVPEHLDWHEDMEEYIAAKQQLFINQTENDTAIYYADNENSESIASASDGKLIPYFEKPGAIVENGKIVIENSQICDVNDIALLGKHNWQNVCAAITAVWQVTQNTDAISKVIQNFSGMEHRLELVRELDGVKYYDDSFGTTPETAIVAIEAFKEPKIVILGGSDKGAKFDELAKAVKQNNVKKVLLIGLMADRIKNSLDDTGFIDYLEGGTSMAEIVNKANSLSSSGDIVLLSTACASFDMFKNYKDRGDQFRKAVESLASAD